jgi:diguanylate cyclase (GGDEF)-like protein
MAPLNSRSGQSRFFFLIAVPSVVTVLATAALISTLLLWSTKRADEAAFARQAQLVTLVLGQSVNAIGYDQESVTVWDDAVQHARAAQPDLDWFDDNFGIWLYTYFGHDQAFVLTPEGEPIYAMEGGERADPARYTVVRPVAEPLLRELKQKLISGETADGTTLSAGAADLVVVAGHPAIMSVKPIVSDSGAIEQEPGSEFLHLSVRFLDGSFLEDLAEDYLFAGARFAWTDNSEAQERSYAFVSKRGEPVGFFVWTPYAPGSGVLGSVAPVLVAGLVIIAVIVALLLLRVRRSAVKLQASEAQAQHLAFHDTLTGLPNRALFEDRLDRALLELRRRPSEQVALLYLDLDRFKQVNDSLGHPEGDELLRDVARRLTAAIRETDTVARLGGDEFAIIQTHVSKPEDVQELANRIMEAISVPFELSGGEMTVGISIGVALAPSDASDRVELTRKADIALYQAKAAGRGRYVPFSETMDDYLRERRAIENDLRLALRNRDQLEVYYQPTYSAQSHSIVGAEALIRWHHPRMGLMSAATFIPIAEEAGLIEQLGEFVLAEACAAAVQWPIERLAVNVSPVQLRNPRFAHQVLAILHRTGFDPERLELEITESALIGTDGRCETNLTDLRAAGVRIALDDFGTGYSSLSHLRQFAVDRVKIDRTFVSGIDGTRDGAAVVQAIVDLAQASGLQITAEGVETENQSSVLAGMGCNDLQGFLLSPPVPMNQLDELFGIDPGLRKERTAAIAA